MKLTARILTALQETQSTAPELAVALDADVATIRTLLSQMRQLGVVERCGTLPSRGYNGGGSASVLWGIK